MKKLVVIGSGLVLFACSSAAAQTAALPELEASGLPQSEWSKNFTLSGPALTDSATPEDPTASLSWQEKAKAFTFGGDGRWAMNLDMVSRVVESPLPREEMRAGASYQFTPRFSLGGSVTVGANELDDASQWKEQNIEAGVRLKTTFKF
ncbi:MAG: hypothetical protein CMK09_02500 [Ponticaulis sp.]|nr:hypothetical protein [Ponticaulis sp.]|tara:strand:+ start:4577 stop:5023 length:447 start_codon:yes stop_codon:yes gene_type:complete